MATTPVVPTGSSSLTPTSITKDITWIRTHALIAFLAVALIAGSIIGGMSIFEGLIERHDARVALAQQKAEGVDTATQAALFAQLAQDRAANQQRDAAQTALITSLVGQMKQQHAATNQQVATDATLDAKAAGARLATQTKASEGDVTVGNDTVTMSLPLTRQVVTDLDLLPQAQADVVNLQGQLSAEKIEFTDAMSERDAAALVITADKEELIATVKADDSACKVRVDAQAKKDRKRMFWLIVVAALGGGYLGHAL